MDSLCEKLKQMSTDNSKHQNKKDRKQQRSSFRDILHYIEVTTPGCCMTSSCDLMQCSVEFALLTVSHKIGR